MNSIRVQFNTKKSAQIITGSLSKPGKMPCKSYGLPAAECKVGSKLRQIEGSVCFNCYALKGQYRFDNVQNAQYSRLRSIKHPDWINAMVKLIGTDPYFRWHDSGDIQDLAHLGKIVQVCEDTPNCRHWLPTREKSIIRDWVRYKGPLPENLTIRISAPMIGHVLPLTGILVKHSNIQTSSVHNGEPLDTECIAYTQGGECRDCRACWNPNIANISYPEH